MSATPKCIDPRKRTIVSARIRLIVELDLPDRWGGDCPLDQVYRQAARAALEKVSRLVGREGRVSAPEVVAVLAEETRS